MLLEEDWEVFWGLVWEGEELDTAVVGDRVLVLVFEDAGPDAILEVWDGDGGRGGDKGGDWLVAEGGEF